MTTSTARIPRTTVNRFILFLVIGIATVSTFFANGVLLTALGINDGGVGLVLVAFVVPLASALTLILMFIKERRISRVRPKWAEFLLAGLGAFFPPVLVAVVLGVIWWIIYGIASVIATDPNPFGEAYLFAGVAYGLLSLGLAIYLVRMNWRHVVDQLYPHAGSKSAFDTTWQTGKLWLVKRAILLLIAFFVSVIVFLLFLTPYFSEGAELTIGDSFIFTLFWVVVDLFIISISAWLWLRRPEVPGEMGTACEAITRLLESSGFQVRTVAEIKTDPAMASTLANSFTASIDLVALKDDTGMVIDVMTNGESGQIADLTTAAEFRTAAWYLERVLELPDPVAAMLVLVDMGVEEGLTAIAEGQGIDVIQMSGEDVLHVLAPQTGEDQLRQTAASLFRLERT